MALFDKALRMGEGKKFKEFERKVARINDYEPELELESDEELRARYEALRERALGRRVARRPPVRELRGHPRGRQAHARPAPLRRPADRRHGPPRRLHRRDEDRRGQDADLHAADRAQRARRPATRTATPSSGKGVHLVTVNDYLARRDALWMKPIYDLLGVTVGILQSESRNFPEKHAAYDARRHLRHQLRVRASTTCATTWPPTPRRSPSAATASRSSTRSTTSSSTRRARR